MNGPARTTADGVLVIGYGNRLRGDDGVGPRVADAIAQWGKADVRTLAVHQLVPELAEPLAAARLAIFVDVRVGGQQAGIEIQRLELGDSSPAFGHTSDPRGLLALAQALYGHHPPAWWIMVPGVSFAMGDELSLVARNGVEAALREITKLIRDEAIVPGAIIHARSRIDARSFGDRSGTGGPA